MPFQHDKLGFDDTDTVGLTLTGGDVAILPTTGFARRPGFLRVAPVAHALQYAVVDTGSVFGTVSPVVSGTHHSRVLFRCFVRLNSYPTSTNWEILEVTTAAQIFCNTTGHIGIRCMVAADTSIHYMAHPLPRGAWTQFVVTIDFDPTSGFWVITSTVTVDGVGTASDTDGFTSTPTISPIAFGDPHTGTSQTGSVDFDAVEYRAAGGTGGDGDAPLDPLDPIDSVFGALTLRCEPGIQIHDVLNDAPNTANFTVESPEVVAGRPVVLVDPASERLLFAGTIERHDQTYAGRPSNVFWPSTAIDQTWRLTKYRPFGSWVTVSASDVVEDLIAQFAPGITTNHVQQTLAPVSIVCDGSQTLPDILTMIATRIGGGHWFVDYGDPRTEPATPPDLHFFRLAPGGPGAPPPPAVIPRPDGPSVAPTIAEGASAGGPTISAGAFQVHYLFRYADGAVSHLSPGSVVLMLDGTHQIDISDLEIGTTDPDHGAVTERWLLTQSFFTFGLGNPAPPLGLIKLVDNTTTAFTYTLTGQPDPVRVGGFPNPVVPFPRVVSPRPDAPADTLSVTLDSANRDAVTYGEAIDRSYVFAVSGVYDDGVESLPTAWTDPIVQHVGPSAPEKKFLFADLPIVDDFEGHVCRYRKIYAQLSYTSSISPSVTDALIGWLIVPDNTTTDCNDDGRGVFAQFGFDPNPFPVSPREDGPDLETEDAPDPIDLDHQTWLADPPITVSNDDTQVRTRVFVRGAGSTTTTAGSTGGVTVADISVFARVGAGQRAIIGTEVRTITVSGSSLLVSPALSAAVPIGTAVALWVERNDLAAQAELAAASNDDDDGVREYTIVDPSLRTIPEMMDRGDAELFLFSRPIRTLHYATRDVKTRSGKIVHVDLPEPPIAGDFLIQEVTIDQVAIDAAGTTVPRFTVTASSSRFTLDDLLRGLLAGGGAAGGGGSSSGGGGGATGATGPAGPEGPPGADGTSVTPAALTKTNDTNVTLALGGTPATALLEATSLTLGWTGTLAPSRGGLGLDASGIAKGGLVVGTAAGAIGIKAVGADGQVLTADAASTGGVKWNTGSGGGGGGGGGLTPLAEIVAVALASADFTTRNIAGQSGAIFQSDYDEYFVELINLVPSVVSTTRLNARMSSNGGSSWVATSSYYDTIIYNNTAGASGIEGHQAITEWVLHPAFVNASSGQTLNGRFWITNPLSAAAQKTMDGTANCIHTVDGIPYRGSITTWLMSLTAMNAIQFYFNAGTILTGTLRISGMPK